jgi:DNA-binding NarL/FixJ family response regulator
MIRVAVVSPRAVVRKGIAAALFAADVTVVGEADDLYEGHDELTWDALDVVVVDASVLSTDGRAGGHQVNLVDPGSALDVAWRGPLDRIALLSIREREVLDLIGDGLSNQAIASRLAVAERTVKTHVGRILTKLRVESRLQAGLVTMAHRVTRQFQAARVPLNL